MTLWDSKTYQQDVKRALEQFDVNDFKGKRILVTGASGLICSAIIDLLICANQELNAQIIIYVTGRNCDDLRKRFSYADDFLHFVYYDATREFAFKQDVDYIIHGASNSSPDKYVNEPVETLLANVIGVQQLLNYAKEHSVQKFVYISSSEVYGKLCHGSPLVEDEYGDIDILAKRSSYPMGKRAAETLAIAYSEQYNLNISIVRPGHIYGPTARKTDNRVSSMFSYQAAEGKNLVMKSLGSQIRSYCHCIDCATAILTVLTKGKNKEAYNISNKNSIITIRQMAEILASSAGVQVIMELPSDAEMAAFNPMDNSSLNSNKLEALGWCGQFDACYGLGHTVKVIQELL